MKEMPPTVKKHVLSNVFISRGRMPKYTKKEKTLGKLIFVLNLDEDRQYGFSYIPNTAETSFTD
jgi:hypothetical protein